MYFAKTNLTSGRGKSHPGFKPNQRIPDDHFSPEEFERLIKAGAVMQVASEEVMEPVAQPQPVQTNDLLTKGMWSFQPEDLEDASLEDLNMLVAQHIQQHGLAPVDPFEDREEAVAFMTADNEE